MTADLSLRATGAGPVPAPGGLRPPSRACVRQAGWPLERVLFALAGSVTLLSAGLAATVSRRFLLPTAVAGLNQWLYVLAGACPASLVLRRVFRLRSVVHREPDAR
jgi:hypothetical protein